MSNFEKVVARLANVQHDGFIDGGDGAAEGSEMIEYITIEAGKRVGNLPTPMEILRGCARAELPTGQLMQRADKLGILDAELAKIIAEETGFLEADLVSEIDYERWKLANL